MPIIEIHTSDEFNECLKNNKLCVVDFYSQYCAPCKKIAPMLLEFSEKYTEVTFCKVNIAECKDLANQYEIRALPTLLYFSNGNDKPLYNVVGSHENKIEYALQMLCGQDMHTDDF